MAVGGVGGNQPIENKPQVKQQDGIRRNDVAENQRSIFDKADADKNGVLDKTEQKTFKQLLSNLFGVGKTDKTEQAKPTGKPEDVQGATNQTIKDTTTEKFAPDGSYQTEVKDLGNGNKEIKTGGEKLSITPDAIDVTGKNGESIGGTKMLPNGMQVLTQPDGKQGVYDPSKGQFLPDSEAQKILAQMG